MELDIRSTLLSLALALASGCNALAAAPPAQHPATAKGSSPAASSPLPQEGAQNVAAQPVALVSGQPISEGDLAAAVAADMLQLHQQEYQAKSKVLDGLIRQKLLEVEAQKRGITVEKLYEEVDAKVPAPSDDEVAGYYLAVKSQVNRPLPEVKEQLQKAVKTLKTQQARQDYADSLRAKAEVTVLLRPPKVDVTFDPARVRGDAKAPITIVEFSDFECPYCKRSQATLKSLLSKHAGQVKLAFRDYPLSSVHPQAEIAAEASRCAGEQGKFWEFHDALFDDQSKLDEAGLGATAQKIGLEEKSFKSCLASGKYKAKISQDEEDGKKAGVTGTPGFFVAGVFVNGALPEAEFEKIISAELAALKSQTSTHTSH